MHAISACNTHRTVLFLTGMLMAWSGLANAQTGYLRPAASIGREYDDNLFFEPTDPEADLVTRARAGIDSRYETARLDLTARYAIDAERYADHPELDTGNARQRAVAEIRYRPTRRFEFSMDGEYVETSSPGELSPETGLSLGRLPARRLSGNTGISYRFSPDVVAAVAASAARDSLEGGIDVGTYTTTANLEKRFSDRNTARVAVESRRFEFDGAGTVSAQVLAAGWTARLTRQTLMTLSAGPYMTGDIVKPEVSAVLKHDHLNGSMSLRYARRQSVVAGHPEPIDTESLAVVLEYVAKPAFGIRVIPNVVMSTGSDSSTEIRRLDIEAAYMLEQSVALVGRFRFGNQQGALDGLADIDITRNTAFVGLVVTFGSRSERERSPLEQMAF